MKCAPYANLQWLSLDSATKYTLSSIQPLNSRYKWLPVLAICIISIRFPIYYLIYHVQRISHQPLSHLKSDNQPSAASPIVAFLNSSSILIGSFLLSSRLASLRPLHYV